MMLRTVFKLWRWWTFFLAVPTAMFIGLNLFDEELKPEAASIINERPQVSPESVQGFKYVLGIRVDRDQDPRFRGEEIYEQARQVSVEKSRLDTFSPEDRVMIFNMDDHPCRAKYYCDRKLYLENKKVIDELLQKSSLGIRRIQELLDIGSIGSDLPPSVVVGTPIMSVFSLMQIKRLEINKWIHDGQYQRAVVELRRMNDFLQKSFKNPNFLIYAMIYTVVLSSNRYFLKEAATEYPDLKKHFADDFLSTFQIDEEFDSISERIVRMETAAAADAIQRASGERYAEVMSLSHEKDHEPSFWGRLMGHGVSYTLKPNKTLNQYFAYSEKSRTASCVKSEEECDPGHLKFPWWSYIVNPAGKGLVMMLAGTTQSRFEKLYKTFVQLREPLKI